MAKKNFGSFSKSGNGKDFNFGFEDGDSNFDDFNFDDRANTNTRNNRDPILQVRQGISAGLSSSMSSFIPGLSKRISQNIPDAAKFAGEVGDFTSDLMYMGNKLQQDIAPTVQQLKRAARTLGPRVKQFLPKSMHQGYDNLMSDSGDQARSNAKLDKEKSENMAIASSLDSVFKAQMRTQADLAEDQKTDTILDRALAGKRHTESFNQLQAMRAGTAFHQSFIQSVQIPYMKKDLELKYRHYFVAKDSLSVLQGMSKIVEKKLDEIRHNTGLPEIQKMTRYEGVKEVALQRFSNMSANWAGNMLKKLQSRVLDPFKEGLTMAGDAAEMMADSMSTMDELRGGTRSAGAQVGGVGGMIAGNWLAKKTGKLLFGEQYGKKGLLSNQAASLNNLFKNAKTRMGLKIQQMSEDREGTFLGELLSILSPDIARGTGRTANVMTKDPNAPGMITNAFTLSVTTIMPGYMAKMVKLLEEIKTGKSAEELVFDTDSNDFVAVSTIQRKFANEAFGSVEQRRQRISKNIGAARGLYKATSGGDLTSFDAVESDFATLIQNCQINKKVLEPRLIKEYAGLFKKIEEDRADSDDFEDVSFDDDLKKIDAEEKAQTYMRMLFKGVQNPFKLLTVLAAMLFDKDGHVDRQSLTSLNNMLIDEMHNDQYMATFQKYIQKQGMARHLKPFISSSANGSFTHNESSIRNQLRTGFDRNDDAYLRDRDMSTDNEAMYQSEIRSSMSMSDFLNDPEMNGGLVGWIRRKVGDRGQLLTDNIGRWSTNARDYLNNNVRQNIPKEWTDWASRVASTSHQRAGDFRKSMGTKADKAALIMKLRRLKENESPYLSHEQQMIDPYMQDGLGYAGAFNSMGGGSSMPPFLMASMLAGGSGPTFIPTSAFGGGRAQPAQPGSHTVNTTVNGGESIVSAINQFEETFKEYAKKQETIPDLMSKMLDVSGAMSSQLDALIGSSKSTVGKAFGWVKKHANFKNINTLAKASIALPWTATKWGGRQAGRVLGMVPDAARWTMGTALPFIGGGLRAGAGSMISGALTAGKWSKDLAMGGLGALGLSSDVMAGKLATGLQWLRDGKANVKDGYGSIKKSISQKFKDKVYLDVYVKDKVDPGNPILSKRQQEDGVVFVDSGKKLLTTYALNRAVMDPETKDVLVTEQNIKDGLVDINNKDIMGARSFVGKAVSGVAGMLGAGVKGIGKTFMGLVSGGLPMGELLGKAMGMGFDGMRMFGRGASALTRRIFGMEESVNSKHLKEFVGDKLDIIIALLRKQFGIVEGDENSGSLFSSGGSRPGDEDGDGQRDNIFEARRKKQEEKEKKAEDSERRGFYDTMKSIKDGIVGGKGEKKGLMDRLMGLFGAGGIFGTMTSALGGILNATTFLGSGMMKMLSFVGIIGKLLARGVGGLGRGAFNIGGGLLKRFGRMGRVGKALTVAGGLFAANALMGGDNTANASELSTPDDVDLDKGGSGSGGSLMGDVAEMGAWAAGTHVAGKVGSKVMSKMAIRQGGRMAARAAVGAAGASSGPVGWAVGGGLLAIDLIDSVVFDGKYSQNIYNWIGVGTDEFAEIRCKLYGVDTSWGMKNLMGDGTLRQTIKLEDAIYEIADKQARPFTDADFEEWTNRFGLDSSDTDQVKFWVTWYRRRFLPICKSYFKALKDHKVTYSGVHSASDEVKNQILSVVQGECAGILQNTGSLVPTPEAYAQFKKKEQKWKDDTSENATKAKQAAMAKAREDKSEAGSAAQGSGKYDLSSSQAGAMYNGGSSGSQDPGLNSAYSQLSQLSGGNQSVADILGGGAFNIAKGNSFVNSGTVGAAGMMGGMTSPGMGAVDLSKVNPAQLTGQPGQLGSYVQRFESGGKGSAAIAYDATGGTSYGSYQLSSRRGSLGEFVKWCQNEAPEVYRTLAPMLGRANTGNTTGEFPTAWLQLVQAGKITHDLEYKYYTQKFYGRALGMIQKASPELAQFIQSNRALQECLWSVSVQHGPGGALNMFKNVYKPGITPEDFLRQLYSERYTPKYFNELSKSDPKMLRNMASGRGPSELGVMLGLLGQGPADSTGAPSPGGAMAGNTGAPAGATPAGATVMGGGDGGMGAAPTGGGMGGGGGFNQANPTPDAGAFTAPSINSNSGFSSGKPGEGIKVQGGADFANVHPALKERMNAMGQDFMNQFGQPIGVTSGKRSMEGQAKLFAEKGPGLAARPSPFAPHIAGVAIDANSDQMNKAEKAGLLDKYGLWRPLKNGLGRTKAEPWHVELKGSRDPNTMKITAATMSGLNNAYGAGVSPDAGSDTSTGGAPAGDTSGGGFMSPSLQDQRNGPTVMGTGPSGFQQTGYAVNQAASNTGANIGAGGQPTNVNDPALNQSQSSPLSFEEMQQTLKDILQVLQGIFSSGEAGTDLLEQLVNINQELPASLSKASSGSGGANSQQNTPTPGFQASHTGEKIRRTAAA